MAVAAILALAACGNEHPAAPGASNDTASANGAHAPVNAVNPGTANSGNSSNAGQASSETPPGDSNPVADNSVPGRAPDAWTAELRRVEKALPRGHRKGEPVAGRWVNGAFAAGPGKGLAALRTNYEKGKTPLVTGVKTEGDVETPVVGSVNFQQQAEFFVIAAGSEASRMHDALAAEYDDKGWERNSSSVFQASGPLELPYWREDKTTVYLGLSGDLLLFARETDGEHEIGGGHGENFGQQIMLLFLTSLETRQ